MMSLRHAFAIAFAVALMIACGGPHRGTTQPAPPKPTMPACDAFFSSSGVQRVIAMLDKLGTIDPPPWSDYRPEDHPLVLLGPDRPAPATCALVWRGSELLRLALF